MVYVCPTMHGPISHVLQLMVLSEYCPTIHRPMNDCPTTHMVPYLLTTVLTDGPMDLWIEVASRR